ncbi:MAG: ribonuclease Z [Bacteroidales bacterium]|nr:ribonuclease Z [Bacteroidales bacterium]
MNFTLKIMGTASAMPVVERFQSAHVLDVHGRSFLIDCGEGVQGQLKRYGVSLMKLDSIFISHIHGDHLFGLFGLLSTIGMLGRTAPMNLYGPPNLGPVLKFFLSFYGEGLSFEVRFTPLKNKEPDVIYETKSLEVLAFPLNHGIETYGYLFREKKPQYNVRKEVIEPLGLTRTEIGTLKRGEDVVRPDGTVIPLAEAAYLPYVPRSYAYVSDTAPFPELAGWVKGVSLLYHEATYLDALKDQAAQRRHSTTFQAAQCAKDAGAGKLIIGHYSSRCSEAGLYEQECRTIFPETYAASDGDVFDVPLCKPI